MQEGSTRITEGASLTNEQRREIIGDFRLVWGARQTPSNLTSRSNASTLRLVKDVHFRFISKRTDRENCMRALAATKEQRDVLTRHRVLMVLVYAAAVLCAATVSAQRKPAQDEKLKPRRVTLKTKDGLSLNAFYFPTDKGKEAITVLLVHEWNGKGASPYGKFVIALRDAGCAVLAPDYRGHGGSAEFTNARGKKDKFNISQMSRRDVENVINFDLERAKAFLKEENDKENLNLNALVMIGIGEGCVMAANWAQRDWSFPNVGRMKQGQDVKALIYISPEKQIKGIPIAPALNNPQLLNLPTMIVAGETKMAEAKRIGKPIEAVKIRMGRGTAVGYSLKLVKTKLSGPSLVNDVSGVIPAITDFIKEHVKISDDENPWIERN
ncbi:MAG: alpha/beta hydrolase [Rubripirellula sp.]